MTREQGLNLAWVLVLWSKGSELEARDTFGADDKWYPFTPEDYEKLSVSPGLEWRVALRAASLRELHFTA